MKDVRWSRLFFSVKLLVLFFATLLGLAPGAQARVSIRRIVNRRLNPTAQGITQITLNVAPETHRANVYVDEKYLNFAPPYIVSLSFPQISEGPQIVSASAFRGAVGYPVLASTSSRLLRILSTKPIKVRGRSRAATPTPALTSTATAIPTPTPQPRTPTPTPPTPTPKPTPAPAATPTPVSTATSTPKPGSIPTPVALNNPQNPVSYGADATGRNDSTSAFQSAINAGDLDIQAGTYKILGTVTVPGVRNVRCESGASLINQSSSAFIMFELDGNTGGSFFNCHFRGPNYNINASPSVQNFSQNFIWEQSIGNLGTTGNLQIVGNDFNGIGGYTGAIGIYGGDPNQPPPHNIRIRYNTFEHCGYYAVQVTSATNSLIDHNTTNDCSGWVEADDTGQENTGIVIDSNIMNFTYGVGQANPGGNGFDGLTGGSDASGSFFNYSGNTVSNNVMGGTHASSILIHGNNSPATYTNNTCSSPCVIDDYVKN
jgi:hypothetical protein